MARRKDMRHHNDASSNPSFFRRITNNGSSKSINLTKLLSDWKAVKIEVIGKTPTEILLKLTNTEALK